MQLIGFSSSSWLAARRVDCFLLERCESGTLHLKAHANNTWWPQRGVRYNQQPHFQISTLHVQAPTWPSQRLSRMMSSAARPFKSCTRTRKWWSTMCFSSKSWCCWRRRRQVQVEKMLPFWGSHFVLPFFALFIYPHRLKSIQLYG